MRELTYYYINPFQKNNGANNYIRRSVDTLLRHGIHAEEFCPTQEFSKDEFKKKFKEWLIQKDIPLNIIEFPDAGVILTDIDRKSHSIHVRLHAPKQVLADITQDPSRRKVIMPTRQLISKARYISSPTLSNLESYTHVPIPLNNISIYPNSIQNRDYTIDNNRDIDITYIGRLDLIKGADFFRSLLHHLPPGLRVKALGIPNISHYRNNWIDSRIDLELLGWVDNEVTDNILNRSKLVLILSRTESFSEVVAEAITHGCKPIAWNLSSYAEVFPHTLLSTTQMGDMKRLVKVINRELTNFSVADRDLVSDFVSRNNLNFVNGVKEIISKRYNWYGKIKATRSKAICNTQECDKLLPCNSDPQIEFFKNEKIRVFGFSLYNTHIEEVWMPIVNRICSDFKLISSSDWGQIKSLPVAYPIAQDKCHVTNWSKNVPGLLKEISDFKPDVIFIFNGNTPILRNVEKRIRSTIQTPIVFFELGWFPQSRNVYCDPDGVNHRSSIASKTLEELVDHEIPAGTCTRDFKTRRALLVLQLPKDTTLFPEAFPKQMNHEELARYVRNNIPEDFELVIRLHPKDKNSQAYNFDLPHTTLDHLPLEESLSKSDVVIGVNSTVLTEAMNYDVNIYSFGYGLFSNKSLTVDCALESLRENWIEGVCYDPNRRKAYLKYLESIQIDIDKMGENDPEWPKMRGLYPIFQQYSMGSNKVYTRKRKPQNKKAKQAKKRGMTSHLVRLAAHAFKKLRSL